MMLFIYDHELALHFSIGHFFRHCFLVMTELLLFNFVTYMYSCYCYVYYSPYNSEKNTFILNSPHQYFR